MAKSTRKGLRSFAFAVRAPMRCLDAPLGAQDVAMVSILAPSAAKNAALGTGEGGVERDSSKDTLSEGAGGTPGGDAAAASTDASTEAPPEAALPAPGLGLLLRQAVAAATAALSTLPNSCFALAPPPPHPGYSLPQRAGAALWTAVLYGGLGLVCGGAGQARGRRKKSSLRCFALLSALLTPTRRVSLSLLGVDECTDARCAYGGPRHAARSGPCRAAVVPVHGQIRVAALPARRRSGEPGRTRAGPRQQRGGACGHVTRAAPLQQRLRRGTLRGAHERLGHQPLIAARAGRTCELCRDDGGARLPCECPRDDLRCHVACRTKAQSARALRSRVPLRGA